METNIKRIILGTLALCIGQALSAQEDCKDGINYSISNITTTGGAQGFFANEEQQIHVTVGQPYIGSSGGFTQGITSRNGFWGHYLLEPQAPRSFASEGEYLDRIEVEWEVVDDLTGPPVTVPTTKVFRNGRLLTTVPLAQTSYVDYNVFPGEFYTYEIVTANGLGDAKPLQAVGFLQPNGRVTGKVETRTGAPVADVKVVLTPNLGRSMDLDGVDDYAYFEDQAYELDDYYTVEGWWRNVELKNQTIFVAVDSGTSTAVVKVSLDADGKIHYFHDGNADGTSIELVSKDGYNLDQFSRKWHHFAAVYDTSYVYLYVDGNRVAEAANPSDPVTKVTEIEFGKDGSKVYSGYYSGHLDDFRVWSIGRERSEIRRFKDITLTGEEAYLQSYWKFDEQFSEKIFDFSDAPVADREHGFICGVTRSDFISPAQLGAYSDEGGDYLIKGVYYGAGTTFSVSPSKETAIGYSLDFDGTDDFISYQLDRLTYDTEFTLEGWFKTAAAGSDMVLFEATNSAADQTYLQLGLNTDGTFYASSGFGGTLNTITSTDAYNDEFWYHYALTHDGTTATLYIDGQAVGNVSDGPIANVITRTVIGRSDPIESNAGTNYFQGSLDEIRLWNEARTENEVNATLNQIVPGNEQGIVEDERLAAYWMLGEGQGDIISDATPNGHTGELKNFQEVEISDGVFLITNWNGDDIPLDVEYFVHDFEPNSRNASLDPSNTAVDRVDFTDISQIGISGFVKFSNTNCFVEGVELTINDQSLVPPVFTDQDGKFVLELEPGTSGAYVIPKYEGFQFDPGFIELPRLVRPIAGQRFESNTVREIKGVVGGGECLIPTGQANVRLLASNGCFEKTVAVDNATGEFVASDLPPSSYQVSIENHENTVIQSYFDTQGAINVDVKDADDSITFIYTSETAVQLAFANSEANDCGIQLNSNTATLLNQNSDYTLRIQLYQIYGSDTCFLSSGKAYIEDQISDFSPEDTLHLVDGLTEYSFTAGVPNLAEPYQKSITVVGEDTNGDQATGFEEVIVLGYKTLTSTFETTTPELPLFILRDPPGDGSFSYLEENEEVCNTMSFNYQKDATTNTNVALHMGPDITFSTGFIFETQTEIDVTLDMEVESSATNGFGTTVEYESCLKSSEVFTTSNNDLLSDGEGDVFVGGAMNILVGTNRVIDVNTTTCEIEFEDVIMILPKNFSTTYIYTQQFIENNVIPGLQEINNTESVQQWEAILAYNETLKEQANFEENISFSAGIEFERSVSATEVSSSSMSISNSFVNEVGVNTGITVNGMGFTLGLSTASSTESGYSKTSQKTTEKTVGYNLNDDDIGDSYSVDIKTDAQGMPVFDLVAGESMCPWEPGTRNRTGVSITPVSATTLTEVPEDEPAVFRLSLSNTGETAEDQFYELRVLQESNPNGATILVNGVENGVELFIEANKSKEVVVTVEKGPDAFVFNDLELELHVPCEFERVEALGLDIVDIIENDSGRSEFFARQKISAEFVKTCQDPIIFSPGQNWLINGESADSITITLSEIDLDQVELEQFRFQYREQVEGEPFVNGVTILSTDITGNSHSFWWNVTDVDDALYELRAVSECNSGFLPGISELVSGRIDRSPPTVVGTPAPVDAVLDLDDEITIEFEENLQCDAIISLGIPASLAQGDVNNVALTNTETGLAIEKVVNCVDNRLVITPDIQNKFIEGQVLRVDLLGLEDLYGNVQTEAITWEFNVDRDPLEWLGGDIQSVSYENESPGFVRQLKNNGAFAVNVNMSGALDVQTLEETLLPSWITASPRSFTLQSGGTQDVTFTINDQLGGGQYNDVVTAATSFGAPELSFDVRVLCPDPDWTINASNFENSMTFTGQLDIRGELSEDEYDIVAAYVGSELRGVGHVQYAPELTNIPGEHPYLVFMTLYTNSNADEMIEFQVWDASRCQLYGQIAESYAISLSTVSLGSPTNPKSITVTNDIIQKIPLSKGWNWFSLNLNTASSQTNSVLGSLNNARGDVIKSQRNFSQYVPGLGWVGPLSRMDSTKTFRIKLGNRDTLEVIGEPIDFENTTIQLDSGWNWISFLPPVGMELNEALSSVSATADFIIKSQTSFAQYVDFQGWIGSLDFMRPNQGYLVFSDRSATLQYPVNNANSRTTIPEESMVLLPDGWNIDPADYEFNGNLIFAVEGRAVHSGDLIGLFDGDQLRGWGKAVYAEFLDDYLFFVTAWGNSPQQDLQVRVVASGEEIQTDITVRSVADQLIGTVQEPLVVDLSSGVLGLQDDLLESMKIYPNPFSDYSTLYFKTQGTSQVKVTLHNLTGQLVSKVYDGTLSGGSHEIRIDRNVHPTRMASGIYLINIQIGEVSTTKKLVIE